jgi:hypothetical protein
MTTHLTPMPPTRHAAIRDLLVDEVSRDRAARAPRRTGRRPALAVAAALAATAAAGAVALVVVDPAVEASYASWTAVPDTAVISPDEQESLGDWRSRCTDLGTGGIGFPGMKPPEWQPRDVLVDRRGKFVFCVDIAFGAPGEEQTLIGLAGLRADEGFGSLNTMTGVVRDEPVEMPDDGEVLVVGSGDAQPSEPGVHSLSVGQAFGLAGPKVTAIDVVLATGTRVTATVGQGRWGAWWPGEKGTLDGAVLEVRSGKSVRTVALDEVGLGRARD